MTQQRFPNERLALNIERNLLKMVGHKSLPTFRSVVLVHIWWCVGGVPQSIHDTSNA